MTLLFLAKKFITFFVEPLGLILALALVGLYFLYRSSYTKARVLLSISVFLLLFFSYPPVANNLIIPLENTYQKYNLNNNNIEYIHVLGADHYDNTNRPLSSQISNASLKRTIEGVRIFKAINNPNLKMIFTGYEGSSNLITNAKISKVAGISHQSIIINGQPKDTQEEAVLAKSIINDKSFALVTSASHMPRAMTLFKNMGMNPIAAPTDFHGKNQAWLTQPTIGAFKKSEIAIHEFLGIAWHYLIH
ncbi:conserved hypothetical protein [Isorropodon fossajaponicum endosymbiont JTNG4]|uniref:ElyC/SanA/YdcF family protein n=1 Tax=Isorropodon fossajaponicum symbiont TaxID=883811 RepID=UPI0019165772|nr:ElyC/SanA/YdcF family protein [Isorropodon fossajaponicum symbiont]BBB23669.1 conserved hypothetical protein [Isorropodon fossajaponicum endosymbiont JTNG4]